MICRLDSVQGTLHKERRTSQCDLRMLLIIRIRGNHYNFYFVSLRIRTAVEVTSSEFTPLAPLTDVVHLSKQADPCEIEY